VDPSSLHVVNHNRFLAPTETIHTMTLFSSALLVLSVIAGCCPNIIDALPARDIDGLFDSTDDQVNLLQTEVVMKSSAAQPHQDKLEHTAHACKSFSASETADDFQATTTKDEAPNEAAECDSDSGHHMCDKILTQVTEIMGTRTLRRQA